MSPDKQFLTMFTCFLLTEIIECLDYGKHHYLKQMASKITSCIKSGYYSDNYVPYTDYRYYQNVMKFQYIVLQLELQWEQLMAQAEIQGEETHICSSTYKRYTIKRYIKI